GVSLQTLLSKRRRRLPIKRALWFGLQVARLVSKLHAAGWVWRDCKPDNLLVTMHGTIRPVDFEGACRFQKSDPSLWGTHGFVPPEFTKSSNKGSKVPED